MDDSTLPDVSSTVDKVSGVEDSSIVMNDSGLTVEHAAGRLQVSERTIHRRIKQGKLQAHKVDTPRGQVWCVHLDSMSGMDDNIRQRASLTVDTPAVMEDSALPVGETLELVRLVDRLSRDNQQLAGQVGFLQSEIQQRDRQIALLMAPKDEPADVTPRTEPEMPAVPDPKHRPWWKRLFG